MNKSFVTWEVAKTRAMQNPDKVMTIVTPKGEFELTFRATALAPPLDIAARASREPERDEPLAVAIHALESACETRDGRIQVRVLGQLNAAGGAAWIDARSLARELREAAAVKPASPSAERE